MPKAPQKTSTPGLEASFQTLFAGNPLPMWIYDVETLRFLEVNDAAVSHYGYSHDEFLAMRITDIRPAEDVPRVLEAVAERRDAWRRAGAWRHRLKSGQVIDVEITSHELTFAGRSGAFVVAKDLTERTRLEHQLQQAQKMESIGRLAGGIAHDFNNLLLGILNHCDFLLDRTPRSAPERAEVEAIQRACNTAATLTAGLLAFSRRQVIEPTVIDLNAVISDMSRILSRLIGEQIHTDLRLDPALGRIRADRGQMSQLLMNLVVNARDAMPDGGALSVETANVDLDAEASDIRGEFSVQSGQYAMLAVKDSGTGMTPEVQARLFEPFFTTKEPGKGTGLGLASVYGIVTQNRGAIAVRSDVGRGSTFRVYLPIERVTENPEAVPQATAVPSGGWTMLVVEDFADLRDLLRKNLEDQGYKVLTAANAVEARTISTGGGPIHMVLANVTPGPAGSMLAAQLRSDHPNIRVVFMSSHPIDVQSGEVLLQKPFTTSQLLRTVREAL